MENPSPMKKLLLLIPASILVIGCHTKPTQGVDAPINALPSAVVDSPPPVQLWEDDPDYQEDQAGGNPSAPIYDSLGRRIVPTKVANNPPSVGKTPGKGSDPNQKENTAKVEEARRLNQERMRIHDSIQKAKDRPLNGGK